MKLIIAFIAICFTYIVATPTDYRKCPFGCSCSRTATAVCDTMDFPSFGLDILKLKIVNPRKPIELESNFFAGRHLETVDTIYINGALITSIDPFAFANMSHLVSVSFVNCTLPIFDDDTFLYATSLTMLDFDGSQILNFDSIKSESLSQIQISGGNLTRILNSTFAHLEELTLINLSNNYIYHIDGDAFENLLNLEDLNLANNYISRIPPNLFKNNEELVFVNMSGNPLAELDLDNFLNLEILDLSSCNLQEFKGGKFVNMGRLYLSNNIITEISSTAFEYMTDLELIDLSNNSLTSIPAEIFRNNSRMHKIVLDHNNLVTLPKFVSNDNFETYMFTCSYCQLERLEPGVFEKMPGLIILNLSHNKLQSLEANFFETIPSLNRIDISYNLMSQLDVNLFRSNPVLVVLNLAGNQLTALDSKAYKSNNMLKFMDISSNKLIHIWESVDTKLPSVRFLNVANNSLKTITPEELIVTAKLEVLNIDNNPLECNNLKPVISALRSLTYGPLNRKTHEELNNQDSIWESTPANKPIWSESILDECDGLTYDLNELTDYYDYYADDDDYLTEYKEIDKVEEAKNEYFDFSDDLDILDEKKQDEYVSTEGTNFLNDDIKLISSGILSELRPIKVHEKYNVLWPALVFILTTLSVLFVVLNIILFVLRRRGQLPRNINLSWKNGHGGFVYKPLTAETRAFIINDLPTENPKIAAVHRAAH